jgi:hypothetical protein
MAQSPAAIIYDSTGVNPVGVVLDGSIYRLQVEADLKAGHGLATEATVATLATESKLEAVRVLLASIDTKDFATQVTLAALLAAFNAEDFATETKLEAVRALLATIDADTSALAATDFATETTQATLATEAKLEAVRVLLSTIDADTSNLDVALSTRATAAAQTDGSQKSIARSGAKGTAVAADLTSNPIDANTEALHVDGSKVTQPVSAASLPLPAGAATEATLVTLATEAKLEAVRVLAASLDGKDYATQTTLAALLSAFNAEDFATQTTLAALLTNSADIETILTAIRDTAGIKKITDALPAGANSIGTIGDLEKWLGSAAPTVGQKAMAASIPVALASDQSALQVTVGAAASTGAITELLLNTGSPDMVVNGSGTPVDFVLNADATDDIVLTGVRLVFSASFFNFDGGTFGKGGGTLSNGVDINIVANDGTFTDTLATLTVNEDFLRLIQFSVSQAGATDVMAATLPFGGRVVLVGGSSDKVAVQIKDNLAAGARGISYFSGTVYGVVE